MHAASGVASVIGVDDRSLTGRSIGLVGTVWAYAGKRWAGEQCLASHADLRAQLDLVSRQRQCVPSRASPILDQPSDLLGLRRAGG